MNPYYEQKILNSDPVELIGLAYQGAVTFIEQARDHLKHKRISERSAAIMAAYKLLQHLLCSLQPEAAPEISGRLANLYCYMQQRLLEGNAQQIDRPLQEVLGLLATLSEGWEEVRRQLATGDEGPRAAQVYNPCVADPELAEMSKYAVSA
jgi:flagellar protein FliS